MARLEIVIVNKLGLHARAAAKLVQCASGFDAQVAVERNGQRVNAKSIMGVMMLAASQGTEIAIEATGKDASDALDALSALIQARFGEAE